jgi:hypothetical protein
MVELNDLLQVGGKSGDRVAEGVPVGGVTRSAPQLRIFPDQQRPPGQFPMGPLQSLDPLGKVGLPTSQRRTDRPVQQDVTILQLIEQESDMLAQRCPPDRGHRFAEHPDETDQVAPDGVVECDKTHRIAMRRCCRRAGGQRLI